MSKLMSLARRNEFSRAYAKGRSYVSDALVTYVVKNYKKGIRVGITTSKKVGKAVQRNRARRVIKESARQLLLGVRGNLDIVFVARKNTLFTKTPQMKIQMLKSLEKLNVLKRYDNKGKTKISTRFLGEKEKQGN